MSNHDRLIVVGLTGPAGSGKDTVARILCALAGFERVALADPMKMALVSLGGATLDPFKELDVAARKPPEPGLSLMDPDPADCLRSGLQLLGTESREEAGSPTQWIDVALSVIHYFSACHPKPRMRFVVPDIRHPAEANRIKAVVEDRLGGIYETWRVKPLDGHKPIRSSHPSETSIDQIRPDREVRNARQANGLRTELAGRVIMSLCEILNPSAEAVAR